MRTTLPEISLVVSTIGRPEQLARLLTSLTRLDHPEILELILVDQTTDQASAQFLEHANLPFQTTATTSPRGLSIGRNAGLDLASAPLVAFPDDDCWYEPDTLDQAAWFLNAHPEITGVSGVQRTEDGRDSMLRWATEPSWITRRNFYRTSISSTLILRTERVRELGGFDPTLGAGSSEGFMSGEESDLVLRILQAGGRLRYEPRLVVLQEEPRDQVPDGYVDKMAGYGRGFGRLFADHQLSKSLFGVLLGRKLAGSVLNLARSDLELARADKAFLIGAVVGYRLRSTP